MKKSLQISLVLVVLWIAFKLFFFYIDKSEMSFNPGVMLNVLFILIAASLGIYLARKENNFAPTHFLDDFKNAMKSSIIYVILISGFIYFYYSNIDHAYMERRIAEKIELAKEQTSTPEKYQELKENNPNLKNIKADKYVENVKKDAQTIHSAYVQSTLSLLSLFVLSLIYALGVTFIFRKIVFKNLN